MAAEYAECPDCFFDGPQVDLEDGYLECGDCGSEFENPFWEG